MPDIGVSEAGSHTIAIEPMYSNDDYVAGIPPLVVTQDSARRNKKAYKSDYQI